MKYTLAEKVPSKRNLKTVAGKIARIQGTKMSYRMRLAAITAADTRPGKVWGA